MEPMLKKSRVACRKMAMYVADAFSSKPFSGNPAAVCLVPKDFSLDDSLRQRIAAEMRHSETAFVCPRDWPTDNSDGFAASDQFDLRWFTPTCEVRLCGHATLATAAVLIRRCGNTSKKLIFHTLGGALSVERSSDGGYVMTFPAHTPRQLTGTNDREKWRPMLSTLKVGKGSVFDDLVDLYLSEETQKLIAIVSSEASVAGISMDDKMLQATHDGNVVRGVVVTAKGHDEGIDFVSRYFAPWNGIPEDPVNGSSHTNLAPMWAMRLGKKGPLWARVLSQRGGELRVEHLVEAGLVTLGGDAHIILQGHFEC